MSDRTTAAFTGDPLARIGGIALIVGGILILTSVAFPRPDDPADHAGFLARLIEQAGLTTAIMLTVPAGILALAIGIVGISSNIGAPMPAAIARIGLFGVLVGAAVIMVQFGLGAGALVEGSTDVGVTLWASAGFVRTYGMLVTWFALGGVGVAMAMSDRYPSWIGGSLGVFGVAMVLASALAIVTGPTLLTVGLSSGVAALTAVWAVLAGAWLTRRTVGESSRHAAPDADASGATRT